MTTHTIVKHRVRKAKQPGAIGYLCYEVRADGKTVWRSGPFWSYTHRSTIESCLRNAERVARKLERGL